MRSGRFYAPPSPSYTPLDSLHDSVRFARRCLVAEDSRVRATSSFVDIHGEPMLWHDFGPLEGPGWAANAAGGALRLLNYARFTRQRQVERDALGLADHVLDGGFCDHHTGFVRGYRRLPSGRFVLNYLANNDWFCPGSMARVGRQMLGLAELLGGNGRGPRFRDQAAKMGEWLRDRLRLAPNGWFPRRAAPDGAAYDRNAYGTDRDPFFSSSGAGLFILDLWAALTRLGLGDYRKPLRERAEVYTQAGGFFGSINHDTYDAHECVAYAAAFRCFLRLADLLKEDAYRRFAYEKALAGLPRFEMTENRNGVETAGLLWMEESWNTAYLWENAEAAHAYFEAYADSAQRLYLLKGLTILRAIAKHHYGSHGFLTEGVDWDNVVGQEHHIGQAEFGAIRYTQPLLNNLHIAGPTLYYLRGICLKCDPA